MDIYTTSFVYPHQTRPSHLYSNPIDFAGNPGDSYTSNSFSGFDPQSPTASHAEAVQKLVLDVINTHGCHVSFTPVDNGNAWNFLVSGAYQHAMFGRGQIMKNCPYKSKSSVQVPRSEIIDSPATKHSIKSEIRRRLDEIAAQTMAHIAVVNSAFSLSTRTPPEGISNSAGWSGLETERGCELVITGSGDAIDIARVRLLVMLDELSGLHAEPVEIDRKLHYIIAGRKRHHLQFIQEETGTNIYLPSPLQGLVGPDALAMAAASSEGSPKQGPDVIWITGEFFGVQRARDMLMQAAANKAKIISSRDTAVLPRKLDWMVTDRADDLKTIMHDNATFIQFPPLGSSTSMITIFGDQRVNIQRTIRTVMQLACQYYVASFWLLPVQYNVMIPPPPLNPNQVAAIIQQISATTGAEVVFKSMCFEMHGVEKEVRSAVTMILNLDIVKAFHHEIRFQLELANEQREFISGKKNGKINKIMQTTNAKIKFETFNDHNFLIDVAGNDVSLLQGLALLLEELPAELSFHVPEAYHKRIIGVGGRSIQRIMKKFGVYVKFSNAEEFAALGGYSDNEDNVVARTPAKNAMNLEHLKQAVMEMVNPKDRDYQNEFVSIPRRYHRTLLGEKGIFLHDIEGKTNSKVRFPNKESASDVVMVYGPESQIQVAATLLLEHVPFEADMAVPPHADLFRLCSSPDFAEFAESIKRDYQVTVSPNMKTTPSPPSGAGAELAGECSFKFRCQRSNTDFLTTAREALEQFLLDHNVHVFPSPTAHTHKRGDSFAEAFPHFESKLLPGTRLRESTDLGRPSESLVDRRLRLTSSSPNVKALFNNPPSYMYNLEQHEEVETPDIIDYATEGSEAMDDHWTPLPPIGFGYQHRSRHSEDVKRGDSLLESKMKPPFNKPRSMQNRAQSLDLTYSLSRITEASTSTLPESPTETEGTGTSSSPSMGTAPLFPSVYGPPMTGRPSTTGTASNPQNRRAGRVPNEDEVDETSRVMSNLGL